MTDDRDPLLQALFAEARQDLDEDLDGEAFVAQVMAQTGSPRDRAAAGRICISVVLVACAGLLATPLQEGVQLLTHGLTTSLIDLGDSGVAWLCSPVNNIASLLALSVIVIGVGWKKILSRQGLVAIN